MKRVGKEPRLLPSVMEAIASLKEKQGSTQRQILDHIANTLKKNKEGSRNVTVQVRRALEHGLQSGLIKHRSGKFTLGLDRKDYAIFRRFRQFTDPLADCNQCRRGRRRGRGGRRRRRRRSRRRGRRGRKRPLSNDDDITEDTESGRSYTGGTPEPMDRHRRRRRRGRKGRRGRRGRRGRKRAGLAEGNSETSDAGQKESNPAMTPEKRRSEQDKVNEYQSKSGSNHNHQQERHQERNHQERNQEHDDDDNVECGNPECLCSVKQGDNTPRCMSRENTYYNDSYLN